MSELSHKLGYGTNKTHISRYGHRSMQGHMGVSLSFFQACGHGTSCPRLFFILVNMFFHTHIKTARHENKGVTCDHYYVLELHFLTICEAYLLKTFFKHHVTTHSHTSIR